jgi:hypothetical protein
MRRIVGTVFLGLVLGATPGWALDLTPTQQSTLVAYLQGIPELADEIAAPDDPALAAYLNTTASPNFWVLKSLVSLKDVYQGTSVTGSMWNWTVFFTMPTVELERWRELWVVTGTLDPRQPNVTPAILALFSASLPGDPYADLRTHLTAMRRRAATRLEQLFATGTGSANSPATAQVEGEIAPLDVAKAFGRTGGS